MDLELSARIQEISENLNRWQQIEEKTAPNISNIPDEDQEIELGSVKDQINAMEKIIIQLKAIEESIQSQINANS